MRGRAKKRALGVPAGLLTSLTLSLAACTGNGTTSRQQFVNRADAVCERTRQATNQAAVALFTVWPTTEELSTLLGQVIPALKRGFADLGRLRPPAGDAPKVRSILSAGDEGVARLSELAARAGAGDEAAVPDFFTVAPFARFEQEAGEYGLGGCSRPQRPPEEGAGAEGKQPTFTSEKAEFIKKGDAACAQFGDDKKLIDPFFQQRFQHGPPTLQTWAVSLRTTFLFFYRQQVQALRAIEPPAADQARVSAALNTFDDLFVRAQSAVTAATAEDKNGFLAAFTDVAARSGPADRALRDYGFTKCAPSKLLLMAPTVERAPRLP